MAQTSSVLCESFSAGKPVVSYAFSGIDELSSFYAVDPRLVASPNVYGKSCGKKGRIPRQSRIRRRFERKRMTVSGWEK